MSTTHVLLLLFGAFLVSRLFRKRAQGPLPPGPKGLPFIGSALDIPKTFHALFFASWSQRWGDIMSFSVLGTPFVILNSAQHAIDILNKKSAIYSSRAPIPVGGDMVGWNRAMILQPYGRRMRETRKLLGLVMANQTRLERFHSLVEEETREFLLRLPANTSSLFHEVQKLTGSIIVMIAYGYKAKSEDDAIIQAVQKAIKEFALVTKPGAYLADIFPFLRHIPSWCPGGAWKKTVAKQRETFNEMVELPYAWVKAQMAAGTAPSSFASALLEENMDPEKEEIIKMAAASLYAGGADTTVSSIVSFYLAMVCHPEVQRKAQAEIDAVIGPDRLPTLADRDRLPYLNAVVLELLRWMPVAPMGFPHLLIEDDVHAGYFLPKGTLVMVNIWKLLHDSEIYSDPTTFNPDRFMATTDKEAERDPRDFAFGFGRRRCPGILFAEASIFAVCAMTLAVYNMSKATDKDGNIIEPSMEGSGEIISHPTPFECNITVRSSKAQALLDVME